jgi:hypothetical protein
MKDKREDQLLCPDCYVPVEMIRPHRLVLTNWYTCGNCSRNYDKSELIRASELEERIKRGMENEETRQKKT